MHYATIAVCNSIKGKENSINRVFSKTIVFGDKLRSGSNYICVNINNYLLDVINYNQFLKLGL